MRTRDERGSITPFAVIVALAILLLAALIIDGGRQLNAKGRAVAYAQESARAGSQVVDVTDPRLELLPGEAMKAAGEYCRQARAADPQLVECRSSMTTVHEAGGTFAAVSVTTHVQIKSILLGLIDRSVLSSTGRALARPVSGISEADSGKQSTVGPPDVLQPGEPTPPPTAPPPTDETVAPCTPRPTATPKPKPKPTKPSKPGKPGKPPKPKPTKPPNPPYCKKPADG